MVLLVFSLLFIFMGTLFPVITYRAISNIPVNTILSLAGLLIITTAIKDSGYIEKISGRILSKINTERKLAFFLALLSFGLSPILTNDIALFIVVPLTLGVQKLVKEDLSKILIFEVIAVNAGSMLTPIGNPQNLFIWHQWGISFMDFITIALFPVIILLSILLLFLFFLFPQRRLSIISLKISKVDPRLFYISFFILFLFIISMNAKMVFISIIAILLFYLFFYRKTLKNTDWILILILLMIFIDFGAISNLSIISDWMYGMHLHSKENVYFSSIILSQVISNVPATVFISKFTGLWIPIFYGVNVGGNGLLMGSLANLIAMRISKNGKAWLKFHIYSIPYLMVSAMIIYFLLISG